MTSEERPTGSRFLLRSRFFRFFGGAYTLYDESGALYRYAEMKRFRLKEDIRIYADAEMREEHLRIRTQSVFDFSGAYDVEDSRSQERIGTLRRSGMRSTFMRDHWQMLDEAGEPIAELQEDSLLKALIRRLPYLSELSFLLPQRYDLSRGEQTLGHYQQRFNPLIYKLDIDFSADTGQALDRRLGIAMAVLLAAIEGRQ